MVHYTKHFTWFEQVVDPAVEILPFPDKPVQFKLGYRCASNTEKEFLVKFKIRYPRNSTEAIEITHGYLFSVNEDFNIGQNLKELAGFFTFLVAESLNKVNHSLPGGRIRIPSRRSLTNAIYTTLLSGVNL